MRWTMNKRWSRASLAAGAAWCLLAGYPGAIRAQQPGDAPGLMRVASTYQAVPNMVYRTAGGQELMLDLYQPNGLSAPNPVVMFFHLGGWTQGTKESALPSLLPWMEMGFSVLNVEYRLTSAALAPAAVEDARCALRWVYRNQKQYNFDVTKIVTTGQSAGGHLAMLAAMLPASAGMDSTCPGDRNGGASNSGPNNTDPMKVAAIVDQYGIPDVRELLSGPNLRSWAVAWFGTMPNRDDVATKVSPVTYAQAGMPPVFSVHGDQDPTVPYVLKQRFHQMLDAARLPHELFTVAGGRHGGWSAAENGRLYAAVRTFLTKHGVLAPAITATAP
jgi:acetyl esterase/lipase